MSLATKWHLDPYQESNLRNLDCLLFELLDWSSPHKLISAGEELACVKAITPVVGVPDVPFTNTWLSVP